MLATRMSSMSRAFEDRLGIQRDRSEWEGIESGDEDEDATAASASTAATAATATANLPASLTSPHPIQPRPNSFSSSPTPAPTPNTSTPIPRDPNRAVSITSDGSSGSMGRTDSATNLLMMGQWTSPTRLSSTAVKSTASSNASRGKSRTFSDSGGAESASFGSGSGDAGSGGDKKKPPPGDRVIFKEAWSEKEARLRPKSSWGHLPGWKLFPVFIKSNDDLRQEQLTSQLIKEMAQILCDGKVRRERSERKNERAAAPRQRPAPTGGAGKRANSLGFGADAAAALRSHETQGSAAAAALLRQKRAESRAVRG
jgi:hypothetical protein